ncbi:DUF4249 domain-containing protein [Fibrisoma montanum]|nr:DUF4249 domain-containing protein [Fibrisoma montanum]
MLTPHMTFYKVLFVLLLSSCLLTCVTPYQPEVKSIPRAVVVEGLITDQPGPYSVNLTYTSDYTNVALNLRVSGAQVAIVDDQGRRQSLRELGTGSGIYQTPADYRGQTGRTYRLEFTTADGKRYQSKPELLKAAPKIDSIYAEYSESPIPGTLAFDKGFNIYVDTRDPATTGDYYRWRWTHYEPISICSIRQVPNSNPGVEYSYPCCSECWDIVRCYGNACINVATDALINGRAISRQLILRAPYESTSKYYVEIEQQTLSREAYNFWSRVDKLTNSNGGIFDAAPAGIQGNVVCVSNPDEPVYGFFGASGASLVPYTLNRGGISSTPNIRPTPPPFPPGPPPPCTVCEESQYRTPTKPRWWVY